MKAAKQPFSLGFLNRIDHSILLDRHVICVQKEFAERAVDLCTKVNSVIYCIQIIHFIAVHNFQANRNTIFCRNFHNLECTVQSEFSCFNDFVRVTGEGSAPPHAMNNSGPNGGVQNGVSLDYPMANLQSGVDYFYLRLPDLPREPSSRH